MCPSFVLPHLHHGCCCAGCKHGALPRQHALLRRLHAEPARHLLQQHRLLAGCGALSGRHREGRGGGDRVGRRGTRGATKGMLEGVQWWRDEGREAVRGVWKAQNAKNARRSTG